MSWVIAVGDNDIDYVDVYGTFDTEEEANTALVEVFGPEDDEDGENLPRVKPLQSLDVMRSDWAV
jgi:hypothetical protein